MQAQVRSNRGGKRFVVLAGALLGLLLIAWASDGATVPATITFVTPPPADAVAAPLPSGEVLIVDGPSAELFSPATDTFTKLMGPGQSPTEARGEALAATLPSGQVLIAGGSSYHDREDEHLSSAELFNPATDTFTKLTGPGQSLTEARLGAVAVTLRSGQVLIAGGNGSRPPYFLSSAELFSPSTDTFTKLTGTGQSLTEPREHAVAALLPSGQVLIAGGSDRGYLTSAELFDPATDTFTELTGAGQSLTQGRTRAVAAGLPSGQILIAGGATNGGAVASAELFNPATDTFAALTGTGRALCEVREGPVAASLPSGQVLITGGDLFGENSIPLSSAELFDPTTETFTRLAAKTTSGEVPPTSAHVNQPIALRAYSSSGQVPSLSSATPSVCTLGAAQPEHETDPIKEYKEVSFSAAGTCTIIARVGASAEYGAAQAEQSFTVARQTREFLISFEGGDAGVKVGETRAVEARTSTEFSEAPTLSSAVPGVCTLSKNVEHLGEGLDVVRNLETVHLHAAGMCRLIASLSETSVYKAARTSRAFAVGPKPAETDRRSLIATRPGAVAATLRSGKVLITGGHEAVVLSSGELFDPATETFTKLTGASRSLTKGRSGAVAAGLPSGEVLIAGGFNSRRPSDGGYARYLASAELFNPRKDTFTRLTGAGRVLAEPRAEALAAALPSGQVLIAGGENGGNGANSSAELFNPASDTFTQLTGPGRSLTQTRVGAVAATLPSGEVLIAGGEGAGGSAPSAELFNPTTDTFTNLTGAGEAPADHRYHGVAAALRNGDVLITGGENDSESPASEVFNPTTDTFTKLTGAGQAPTKEREDAVAATLLSGQVLIAGGFSRGRSGYGRFLRSAELFNPSTDTFTRLSAKN